MVNRSKASYSFQPQPPQPNDLTFLLRVVPNAKLLKLPIVAPQH